MATAIATATATAKAMADKGKTHTPHRPRASQIVCCFVSLLHFCLFAAKI